MAVRNCINIFVLYGLEVRLCWPVRISAKYVTVGNLNTRMNPSYIVLILTFRRGLSWIRFFIIQFKLTAAGMNSTCPEIKAPCLIVVEF